MTDKSYTYLHSLSDDAIEKEIGYYIRRVRQQQNKTQKELAEAANISRSTLSLLERGESGNLKTLIQVLRILDKLHVLQTMKYEEKLSPLALAKSQHKPKERIRHSRQRKAIAFKEKSDW